MPSGSVVQGAEGSAGTTGAATGGGWATGAVTTSVGVGVATSVCPTIGVGVAGVQAASNATSDSAGGHAWGRGTR